MRRRVRFLGIIALVALITFSITACGGRSPGNPLYGNWYATDGSGERITFNNDGTVQIAAPGFPSVDGTFYMIDGSVTMVLEGVPELFESSFSNNNNTLSLKMDGQEIIFRRRMVLPSNSENVLLGQWELVEINVARDLVAERMEFLNDGTVLVESSHIRGVGPWAETMTWRIDSDGRLIVTSHGITQIYTIVELSRSTLIYQGNVAGIGNIMAEFSRR